MTTHSRRELIALLGSAAAAWPLPLSAQQPAIPVIGLLSSAEPPAPLIAAFQKGLNEFGYVEGQNVRIERRRAGAEYKQFRASQPSSSGAPERFLSLPMRSSAVNAAELSRSRRVMGCPQLMSGANSPTLAV